MENRIDSSALMAVFPQRSQNLFTFYGLTASDVPGYAVAAGSKIKILPAGDLSSQQYTSWGEYNDWPELIRTETAKNGFALSLLEDYLLPLHYGTGIIPYIETQTPEGKRSIKIYWDDEIKSFFKTCNVHRLQKQIIADYEWMRNYFPELILDRTGKKIAYVKNHSPWDCRWDLMNPDATIPNLLISHNWPSPKEEQWAKIPTLDYDLPLLDLQNRKKSSGDSFILPTQLRLRGKKFYDEAPWHALVTTWLPIANAVPEIKKAIITNKLTLPYHIEVPVEYFRRKSNNKWESLTDEARTKHMEEFIAMVENFLAGKANAGKTLITPTDLYNKGSKETWGIKITPIEDKIKDAAFLGDNYQANVEILQAMGFDPSTTGRSKGGSEDGSGSGKKQSFTIHQERLRVRRETTLYWLDFVRDFNGWNPDIKFMYGDVDVNITLDENPTSKQSVIRT